jgi:hypothetical protein
MYGTVRTPERLSLTVLSSISLDLPVSHFDFSFFVCKRVVRIMIRIWHCHCVLSSLAIRQDAKVSATLPVSPPLRFRSPPFLVKVRVG